MKKIIITVILILMNCTSVSKREVDHSKICPKIANGISIDELELLYGEEVRFNIMGTSQRFKIKNPASTTDQWTLYEMGMRRHFSEKFKETCGNELRMFEQEFNANKRPSKPALQPRRNIFLEDVEPSSEPVSEPDEQDRVLDLPPIYHVTGTIYPNGYSVVTAIPVGGDATLIYSNAKAKIKVDPKEYIVHQKGGKLFSVYAILVKDVGGVVHFSRKPSAKYKKDYERFLEMQK
jgi:hypothetical protein